MSPSVPHMFHLSMTPVRRAQGRSAVSASAYRSATQMTDFRTGVATDYRHKQHVTPLPLILPHACGSSSREEVWNSIEAHCRRRDAVVAREIDAALPLGLSHSRQMSMIRDFAEWISREFQVGVDANLHAKPGNPHGDLLLTANAIGPDGQIGKKVRALDGIASRGSKGPTAVERIRAKWAAICNQVLEEEGRPERLDHRSYKRQGVDRIPTFHMGRSVHAMEQKSPGSTEVGRRLSAIKEENERIQSEIDHVRNERKPRKSRRPRAPKPERESRGRRPRAERQPKAPRRPRRPGVPVGAYMPETPETVAQSGLSLPGSVEHGGAVRTSVRESGIHTMVEGQGLSAKTRLPQDPAGGLNRAGLGKDVDSLGAPARQSRQYARPNSAKGHREAVAPTSRSGTGGGLAGLSQSHALARLDSRPHRDLGDEGAGSTLQPAGTGNDPRFAGEPRSGGLVGLDKPRAQAGGASADTGNPTTDGRRTPRASTQRQRDGGSADRGGHRRESGATLDRVDHPSSGPLRGSVGGRDLHRELEELDRVLKLEIASMNFECEHTVVLIHRPRPATRQPATQKSSKPGR